MDTLTAITTRRSIRNYTGEELDIGLIKELLQYALYAPSAHNQQSWKYYIVSKKEDREFLPEGNRRWTQNKLWKKLDNLSREIISLGPNRPADIIALTEVENDSVMTLLCRRALLTLAQQGKRGAEAAGAGNADFAGARRRREDRGRLCGECQGKGGGRRGWGAGCEEQFR